MKLMERNNSTGFARNAKALPGPSTRALNPSGIRLALLAAVVLATVLVTVLAGLALRPAPAGAQEEAEPLWSADMTVVEYTSVYIGAATSDLFTNIGGSGDLQIKSLWSHTPDRDLRLAFQEGVPDAADYTLQVGDLSLEFPADGSGASSFKWTGVDVDWEDGQLIRVSIVLTSQVEVQQVNTPATGVPIISGVAQVGETLAADTSAIADEDGLTDVSYHYQWLRANKGTDVEDAADIPDATDATYTLAEDDQGKAIRLKVTFIDDQGNSETLTSAAKGEIGKRPEFLVSNLGVNVETGIMRPLNAARPGFAQALTTGARTGGYPLDSVSIQVSSFAEGSTVGDHLRVTINRADSEGGPGDALCTLANPASFPAPGVNVFPAPAGEGACPLLAAETTYFVVIEWLKPDGSSGTGSFALIPQTYPSEETAATAEDEGGALGWSIADRSYYLTVDSDARTWSAYAETASFKLKVEENTDTPATGLPTISGTPQVGETLTASTTAINDQDGLTSVSWEYQWLAGGTAIDGATGSSYELTSGEQGQTIQVRVTFTDDAENQETLTSVATLAVAATVPTAPQSLAVTQGSQDQQLDVSWQAPSSNGGSAVSSYRVQWKEAADSWHSAPDVSEATETGTTHTITDLTGGVEYAVRVLATNSAGDGPASTEAKGTPTGGASEQVVEPENSAPTGLPGISGTPQVDQTLTADTSEIDDADGLTSVSYEYQWLAGGTDIDGATGSSYTLTYGEQGQTVQVRVTYTDDADNEESLTSAATVAVAAAPNREATGLPTIGGTPQVEQTLTADTSGITDEDGLDGVSYEYQWTAGGTDISGATGFTYTLTASEQGKTVQVRVTFTDDRGNSESLTSEATDTVAAKPIPLTATFSNVPASHSGSGTTFTFDLAFSEDFPLSYITLRDHAFSEDDDGPVTRAQRKVQGSNQTWTITVEPKGNGAITVTLPATTDCNDAGAICTSDGRKLSNSLTLTVSGPDQ